MGGQEPIQGGGERQEVGPHINHGSKPPMHALLSHQTSFTKYKLKIRVLRMSRWQLQSIKLGKYGVLF